MAGGGWKQCECTRNQVTIRKLCTKKRQILWCAYVYRASLMAQLVKNPPAMQETPFRFLGWEDPLEKGKATHSGILVWRIPCTLLSMGSQRVGHDWAIFTFILTKSLEINKSVASLAAQSVKNLPAVQKTQVQSLGWEDPLENEMATNSSIIA